MGAAAHPVLRSEQPAFFWFVIGCHVVVALWLILAA
jgi:hypothetical protein